MLLPDPIFQRDIGDPPLSLFEIVRATLSHFLLSFIAQHESISVLLSVSQTNLKSTGDIKSGFFKENSRRELI